MEAPYNHPDTISAAVTTFVGLRTSGATAAGVDSPPIPSSLFPTHVVQAVSLASPAATCRSAPTPAAPPRPD